MIENCLPNHKVCSVWSYHSGYCHLIQISCLNISTGRECLFKLKEHQLVQIWVRIVKISFNVIVLSWHFWVLGSTRLIFCHTLFFMYDFSGAAKSLSCGNILKHSFNHLLRDTKIDVALMNILISHQKLNRPLLSPQSCSPQNNLSKQAHKVLNVPPDFQ